MPKGLLAEEHFAFGKNWNSFVDVVDQSRIEEAVEGMRRLFPSDELRGKTFLDVGCGSGLSSLAATRLGAAKVVCIDIDKDSVAATQRLLSSHLPGGSWSVSVKSVFDLAPGELGLFDIVYSWGVLHHTGDMWRAVKSTAAQVKSGGTLALALYQKTSMCDFWKAEKAWYMKASSRTQAAARLLYETLFLSKMVLMLHNPVSYVQNYKSNRGMAWTHDVHDWLGGFPYESAAPLEVEEFLSGLGFAMKRRFLSRGAFGLFGSGCNEFVATRIK